MAEITDRYKLIGIQQRFPSFVLDPGEQVQVFKAVRIEYDTDSEEWYHVEMHYCQHWTLRGMLDYNRGILYLDVSSMLILVEQRIQAQLDAFNAGHHWRYRGL